MSRIARKGQMTIRPSLEKLLLTHSSVRTSSVVIVAQERASPYYSPHSFSKQRRTVENMTRREMFLTNFEVAPRGSLFRFLK